MSQHHSNALAGQNDRCDISFSSIAPPASPVVALGSL